MFILIKECLFFIIFQLISCLNKYGVCLEPILDDIGKRFIDHAAELVKSGHKFVHVLDNIDWEEKTHDMR